MLCKTYTNDFEKLRFVANVIGRENGQLVMNDLLLHNFGEISNKYLFVTELAVDVFDEPQGFSQA